jgi:phage terminase large subunit-like protein
LTFKQYTQEAKTWQGSTLDFIWLDEESPAPHYSEAISRLTGRGIIYTTFTPLQGFSEVISRFRDDSEDAVRDRAVIRMGLRHVEHFSEEEKRQRLASYPVYERQARENGDPVLGSGAIFSTPETQLAVNPDLKVPLHWAKLWGIDFGVTHPFAAVLIAWDRDADIIYVLDTVRLENARPMEHASAMKRIAADVRVAYPFDGNRKESDLTPLVTNYRREGLLMLPSHATFADGSISTEAGILEMQERMADGRFRVKSTLIDWLDEYRGYHRLKDGKINKIRDDLLSATRVAVMAKRFARPGPIGGNATAPYASAGANGGAGSRLQRLAINTRIHRGISPVSISDLFTTSYGDDEDEAEWQRQQLGNTNPLSPASMQQMVQAPSMQPAAQQSTMPPTSATPTSLNSAPGPQPNIAGLFKNPLVDLQKDEEERSKKLFSASRIGPMFGYSGGTSSNSFMS